MPSNVFFGSIESRARFTFLAILFGGIALACDEARPLPIRPTTFEMRGCADVTTVCEVGAEPLVFFVPDSDRVTVSFEGRELAASTATVAGATGLRVQVQAPRADGTLKVVATDADEARVMTVPLASAVDATEDPTLPTQAPTLRTQALTNHEAARKAYANNEAGRAVELLAEAARLADVAQVPSRATRSRLLAVWIAARNLRDFDTAHAMLNAVPEHSFFDADADVLRAFHESVLAAELGDRRESLKAAEAAQSLAARLGATQLEHSAELRWLRTLNEMGRFEEEARRLRQMLARPGLAPCVRAPVMLNLGWVLIRSLRIPPPEALQWLDGAEEIYKTTCAGDRAEIENLRVSRGLYHLRRGEFDAAEVVLAMKADEPSRPEDTQWRWLAEAELDLARGRTDAALTRFRAIAERADAAQLEELGWYAWVGIAKTEELRGRARAAVEGYAEAEARLEHVAYLVPVDGGRLYLLRDRDESARRWVSLEIARGRPAAALDVVRRARRRALVAIETVRRVRALDGASRRRWEQDLGDYRRRRDALERASEALWLAPKGERSSKAAERDRMLMYTRRALDRILGELRQRIGAADEEARFRAPDVDELMLAWFQLDDARWAMFAADASGVVVATQTSTPTAQAIVDRFRAQIRARPHVTVLAGGGGDRFAIHRAKFGEGALGQNKLVTYSLDLSPRAPTSRVSNEALVVSDPRGDLRAARKEGTQVAENLTEQGWRVVHESIADASRTHVLRKLAGVRLFHFAGHGAYGGREGWDSSLVVADGQLTVGDIVTSTQTPDWVVLSGCRTAQASSLGATAGVGIAQAFLLGGARAVVAADRDVGDEHAYMMSAGLSAALGNGSDLVATYYSLTKELSGRVSDWDAFVLLTP